MAKTSHAQWSSRLTFILAATGSAVGLGNVWMFPYKVGRDGGAAFVLVYLACVAVIGLPILVAEWMIGRRGQRNPINSMVEVARQEGRSRGWAFFGITGVLGACLILGFYSIIGGWSLSYTLGSLTGAQTSTDPAAVQAHFDAFLGNPWSQLLWHSIFMVVTVWIVARGVKAGVEKAVTFMMPALAVVLVVLVGFGMFSGFFGQTLEFMFSLRLEDVGSRTVLGAMGQAFFTLSLGMGVMVAYGSYLGEEVNLLRSAGTVIILDTTFALLAGLAIFPVMFANGLDSGSGPGLIFVTLPLAFASMSGGVILSVLFFILLSFAALTSSISLLEPAVETLEERTPLSRTAAAAVAGVTLWLLGVAALLSFSAWSGVKIGGKSIFDFLDWVTSDFLLPITGLGLIIFLAWFMRRESVLRELRLEGAGAMLWQVAARFLAPAAVIVVFLASLGLF